MSDKYPTMRTRTIKLRHAADIYADSTVSIHTGRSVVDLHVDDGISDGMSLTPAEADRLANALRDAAACCRAKSEHAATARAAKKLGDYETPGSWS